MDWSESPTTVMEAWGESKSFISEYCVWLVSWYSSMKILVNFLRYPSLASASVFKSSTAFKMRSSKSTALDSRSRC